MFDLKILYFYKFHKESMKYRAIIYKTTQESNVVLLGPSKPMALIFVLNVIVLTIGLILAITTIVFHVWRITVSSTIKLLGLIGEKSKVLRPATAWGKSDSNGSWNRLDTLQRIDSKLQRREAKLWHGSIPVQLSVKIMFIVWYPLDRSQRGSMSHANLTRRRKDSIYIFLGWVLPQLLNRSYTLQQNNTDSIFFLNRISIVDGLKHLW
jgi:hypothetical protein